jgi:NAD(P)-dependent dehydrogenase (short-subunit alcohol dehydrogenase family)
MTDTPRSVLAAVQRLRPRSFARIINPDQAFTADLAVASVAELEAALRGHDRLPRRLQVGALRLATGSDAEDLHRPGASRSDARVLDGQVALVSGAASGLGRAVAMGLYQAGACVVFSDIDGAGLQALSAELADEVRTATTVVDVTNEASVAAGFDSALARFGRIDSVHCCAGVAPAHDLVDFPLDRWELSLRINLTGYFLYGREAARIMRAQGHGGAMVLLSSKSGLEPSKSNTAYNATKAGELHMARGWALELGRDGIRVNCIAPGNVFEGSKIWNPDYIAKAALKKGIRPDEVIPYYNSLTALNREIKGADIANAAVFLASEQARCVTGQVLVVDSGQVWTR